MTRIKALPLPTSVRILRRVGGFSLVELLVVVVIVAIVASVGMPLAELSYRRQKEEELRRALMQIRNALDAYKRAVDTGKILRKADESGYPPNLSVLVSGVPDLTDPQRGKIYFLRRLPADPFAAEVNDDPAATWGKRSYASEADAPKEGNDVYDIYSRAELVGMNGITYRKW